MKYGVVLPIWQLTIAEAESLAVKAEEAGLDGVFVPDHILAKPATTQHYGAHWPDPFSLLAGTGALLCAGAIVLATARQFTVAMVVLAVLGCFQIIFSTGCNTALQLIAPDALRGRVMGLYAMAFAGVTPFGSLLIGTIAEHLGVRAACALGGAAGLLAVSALVLVARRRST